MAVSHAGSRRSRRTKRIRYTYASDSDVELSTPPRSQPPRYSRTSRPEQSYREESDGLSDSDIESSDVDDEHVPVISTHLIQSASSRSNSKTPRKSKRPITRSSKCKPMFELFKKRKPNATTSEQKSHITVEIPAGYVPPWQTLPYQALLSIMKFAAFPLYGQASRPNPSISWLLETSRVCKSFHEACIATLLYSPPLYPSFRAHGLLHLLQKEPNTTFTKYRNLIKCLDIEAKNLLLKKSGIHLEDMLSCTPLLQRLRLYHNYDDLNTQVWAQPGAHKGRKWVYPDDFADRLDHHNIKLTSFEWNGRFPSPLDTLHVMKVAHSRRSFQVLRDLTLLNLTFPEKHTETDVQLFSSLLLTSLAKLDHIRSLTFRNCDLINDTVMSRLPPDLSYLEISNCTTFTSDNLSTYLTTAGSSLSTLRLIGNQSMSLGFLQSLKVLCPRLQNLYIDLTYVDATSYRDIAPLYDELLPNGQPTWPATLVNIDLEYLRQFSAEDAEGFFTSLVDAAPDLPSLKRLSIKAIITASWRDRARMRQKWEPKLREVFLCTDQPTPAYLPARPKRPIVNTPEPVRNPGTSSRRSGRIAEIQTKKVLEDEDSDSAVSYSASSSAGEKAGKGTCSVVELSLSDQRPAQDQYNENDFLDDEMSGDEDFRA